MIRRTIATNRATVIGINVETQIAEKVEVIIPGKTVKTRDIFKLCKTEKFTPTHVLEVVQDLTTYEMPLEKFIEMAEKK